MSARKRKAAKRAARARVTITLDPEVHDAIVFAAMLGSEPVNETINRLIRRAITDHQPVRHGGRI